MCQINKVLGKSGRKVHSLARGIHDRRLDKSHTDLWRFADEPVSDKTDVTVTRVLSDVFKATRKLTTWDNNIIANYSETCIKDHLYRRTTCLQRLQFLGPLGGLCRQVSLYININIRVHVHN